MLSRYREELSKAVKLYELELILQQVLDRVDDCSVVKGPLNQAIDIVKGMRNEDN